jgi:dihydroorotate dehydrogenase (fumarate)
MAKRLAETGADGLVLFNRFYEPDFDIEARSVNVTRVSLSSSEDIVVPLRWVALLYGKTEADLALTGGVHTCEDVLKSIMAGASVTMMASELLQNGLGSVDDILRALGLWLKEHSLTSLEEIRGILSVQNRRTETASTERSGYINTIRSLRPEGGPEDHFLS